MMLVLYKNKKMKLETPSFVGHSQIFYQQIFLACGEIKIASPFKLILFFYLYPAKEKLGVYP